MSDRDIFLIEVARRGRDGDYAGVAAVGALDTRVTTLEARPNITTLNAIPNVTDDATTGQTIIKQSDGTWAGGSAGLPITGTSYGSIVASPVEIIETNFGLTMTGDEPFPGVNRLNLSVNFAGTGSETTAARSDHNHTTASITRTTFAPTGYLSSGSRTLATTNVTLASGVTYLVEASLRPQMRGADAGAAYFTMTVTINGNARTSTAGANGFWAVQGVPNKEVWNHSQTITGTGAAITITGAVAYSSGAGSNVDAGELEIRLTPSR